ncbi:ABC transporter permease, partial [Bacteroidota bacterium]
MKKPPRIVRWILSVTNRKSNREIVLGDFEEFYDEVHSKRGKFIADIWFYKQVFKSIPVFLVTSISWGGTMFTNYIKIAFRNILRHKGFSIINITGLALGIACCMLITIYIIFKVSFDDYHTDNDRIFRIVQEFKDQNGIYQTTRSGAPLGPTLKDNFPQVQYYARMLNLNRGLVKKGEISFYEDRQFFTDNDIFKILTIPFLQGDPDIALTKPSTVVITESIAKKYFGDENPLGKTITRGTREYEITGVTADQPKNSHIHFNILISLRTLELHSNYPFEPWFVNNFNTYLKLKPNVDAGLFSKQIDPVLYSYYKNELGIDESLKFNLQPVKDIHLYSHYGDEMEPPGNPAAVTIFSLVSIFILLIACINFMNLSTAKSAIRAKEIGVRKVTGAVRKNLIVQFLTETALMSLISIVFSLLIIMISLPLFNSIAETNFELSDFISPVFAIGLVALTIFITFAAGAYPAFMLSSFRPMDVLKSNFNSSGRGSLLRKILVVSQYTISILLIICSMIIYT